MAYVKLNHETCYYVPKVQEIFKHFPEKVSLYIPLLMGFIRWGKVIALWLD